MGTRLTQFLSGEGGVGGSGGTGTSPGGGSGGGDEGDYFSGVGDNAGGDGLESGEDGESGGIEVGDEPGGAEESGGADGVKIAGNTTPVIPIVVGGDKEEEEKTQESSEAATGGGTEKEEATPEPTAMPSVENEPKIVHGFDITVNSDKQSRHIVESDSPVEGRSIFLGTVEDAQRLVKDFAGIREWINTYKERVDFGEVIGQYVDRENMEKLFKILEESKGSRYILTFSSGDIAEVEADTIYETDNGLELNDPDYEE